MTRRPHPPLDQVGYLRLVRRRLRMSQRELAAALAVSASTVSRAEAGRTALDLATFTRVLQAAGLRLVVVDRDRRLVPPMVDVPDLRDLDGRRFPAHLDAVLDPLPGEWWGDRFGLVRPPETFRRDPAARYAHREVFHRLRGVMAHGEPLDWRDRVRRDRALAQRRLGERAARYPAGVIPFRRAGRPGASVADRARDRDQPARWPGGPALDRAARPDAGAG